MAGISRNEFLNNVREALNKPPGSREPEYVALRVRRENQKQKVVTIEARVEARRPTLLNRLAETAARWGWQVERPTSAEEALRYIVSVARKTRAGLVVRSDHDVFSRLSVDANLQNQGARVTVVKVGRTMRRGRLREEMARARLGITGVDYAIAETGTCVLLPRRGVSRSVSLLPPVHIAIVEASQVYETLDDIFAIRRLAFQEGRGDMGSNMTFISGPSRTADIEQTIVVGVHGPKEAHLLLLDSHQT